MTLNRPGRTSAVIDTLVVTGGHPFEAEPFFAVFDALPGIVWTAATAPEPGHDVVVFYDMPGLRFTRADPPVEVIEPSDDQRRVIEELCEAGTGLVFLHHAVASWPAWPEYAEIVGGRFHYAAGSLGGVEYPDSGYRFDVRHTVDVLEPGHPVCAGLGESFVLTDELYCFPVLTEAVTPLLRTAFDTTDTSQFFSAGLALRGRRDSNQGWRHPPGSPLVAWVKTAGSSPVVYPAVRRRTTNLRRSVLPNGLGQRDPLGSRRGVNAGLSHDQPGADRASIHPAVALPILAPS